MFGDFAFPFAAYVSKTITPARREGNPPPRLWETAAGMINSIGLPNRGLAGYLHPALRQDDEVVGYAFEFGEYANHLQ